MAHTYEGPQRSHAPAARGPFDSAPMVAASPDTGAGAPSGYEHERVGGTLTPNLYAAALAYARPGWPVFPCAPGQKRPATARGLHDASRDPEALRAWWRRCPAFNAALVTGPASGLLVLDLDGDPRQLLGGREVPRSPTQRSGGGGYQVFFRWPAAWEHHAPTTRAALLPSVDTRGRGGYVVVPPSVHPTGGHYRWCRGRTPDDLPPVSPPVWLLDLLRPSRVGVAPVFQQPGEYGTAVESHLAKFRSLVPSLALLCHLVEGSVGPVGERSLIAALAWAGYLESHARRIYAAATGADHGPAHTLAKRLRAGDLADGFTARDVYRKQWSGLGTPEDVTRALALLQDLHQVRPETHPAMDRGGRPTERYRVNPHLLPDAER